VSTFSAPVSSAAGVQIWPVTMDEAIAAAEAAGYRVVTRGPVAASMQRDWRTAATIDEVRGGVVVQRATPTAVEALWTVAALLACLLIGVLPTLLR
jgi:hypothetical protein